MRVELKRLQKILGITTIYVTHDQVEAMTMADRMALMEEGMLQQYDTPEQIYNHPINCFVAGFIGSPPMNFIECSLSKKNKSLYLDAGEFKFRLDNKIAEIINREASSSELTFGIRTENIFVHNEKVKESFEFKVYVIECLGNETLVSAKMGEHILRIRISGTVNAKLDDKIWLTFDKDRIYIFDRKTGRALVY